MSKLNVYCYFTLDPKLHNVLVYSMILIFLERKIYKFIPGTILSEIIDGINSV
jgi:hypothetical protein